MMKQIKEQIKNWKENFDPEKYKWGTPPIPIHVPDLERLIERIEKLDGDNKD